MADEAQNKFSGEGQRNGKPHYGNGNFNRNRRNFHNRPHNGQQGQQNAQGQQSQQRNDNFRKPFAERRPQHSFDTAEDIARDTERVAKEIELEISEIKAMDVSF